MLGTLVFVGIIAAVAFGGVGLYNRLVALKHRVATAWSNIDVLLKQRHDELPKLVDTCRQYMQYEQETLEKVMQARSAVHAARESGDVAGLSAAERRSAGALLQMDQQDRNRSRRNAGHT